MDPEQFLPKRLGQPGPLYNYEKGIPRKERGIFPFLRGLFEIIISLRTMLVGLLVEIPAVLTLNMGMSQAKPQTTGRQSDVSTT
jgi:hypothetical protein